jgi:hypothetical protein
MSEDEKKSRPAFSAPIYAAFRQGGKEFAQVLKAFPDGVQLIEEPGTLGNPTPQMITEDTRTPAGYSRMLDKYASRESERDSPERGMER